VMPNLVQLGRALLHVRRGARGSPRLWVADTSGRGTQTAAEST
jgi:hypothetical protein